MVVSLTLFGAGCSQVAPAQASVSEKAPVTSFSDSSQQGTSARRSTRPGHSSARRNRRPQGNPYGFNPLLKYDSIRVDFGRLPGSDLAFRVVPFRNLSQKAVVVKAVSSSCPCATAVITTPQIPPGGKGQLEIIVDPAKASKNFAAMVSISYEGRDKIDRVQISGQTGE